MTALEQLRTQTLAVWRSMAVSQRLTFGLLLALLLGGFGWMILRDAAPPRVPLFTGKSFTVEESMNAQQILLASGLDDFEQRGTQLYVPSDEVERYNAALLAGGGLPTNWAEEWEKQNAALGQFTGALEREQVKERARAKHVARMLQEITDIAVADVVWDEDTRPGWRTAPKARATVTLRPVPGRSITPQIVRSVRLAVAGSKKHLAPEDVTVVDLATGQSYDGTQDAEFGDTVLARMAHLETLYRNRILDHLSHIRGVHVAVNVNLDRIASSRRRSQKINPKETLAVAEDTVRNQETTQRTTSAAEPGAAPNAALDLSSNRGPSQTSDIQETSGSMIKTASFEVSEDELVGMLPESVTVAISVPKDYYRAMAMRSPGLTGREDLSEDEIEAVTIQMETQESQRIQQRVRMLLPPDATATDEEVVKVDTHVAIEEEKPIESLPLSWTLADLARTWARPAVLIVLALVALYVLRQSLNRPLPELPALPAAPQPAGLEGSAGEPEVEDELPLLRPPENRRREHLQTVVRDNPELAASVIATWVAEK